MRLGPQRKDAVPDCGYHMGEGPNTNKTDLSYQAACSLPIMNSDKYSCPLVSTGGLVLEFLRIPKSIYV